MSDLFCSRCKNTFPLLVLTPEGPAKPDGSRYYICRACNTAKCKAYRNTKNGRLAIRRAVSASSHRHRLKQNARMKLNYHVQVGNIQKPSLCTLCLLPKRLEAHHPDYSKPLDVIWLCRQCHANLECERPVNFVLN